MQGKHPVITISCVKPSLTRHVNLDVQANLSYQVIVSADDMALSSNKPLSQFPHNEHNAIWCCATDCTQNFHLSLSMVDDVHYAWKQPVFATIENMTLVYFEFENDVVTSFFSLNITLLGFKWKVSITASESQIILTPFFLIGEGARDALKIRSIWGQRQHWRSNNQHIKLY